MFSFFKQQSHNIPLLLAQLNKALAYGQSRNYKCAKDELCLFFNSHLKTVGLIIGLSIWGVKPQTSWFQSVIYNRIYLCFPADCKHGIVLYGQEAEIPFFEYKLYSSQAPCEQLTLKNVALPGRGRRIHIYCEQLLSQILALLILLKSSDFPASSF